MSQALTARSLPGSKKEVGISIGGPTEDGKAIDSDLISRSVLPEP
jgi:hypothetical protein